MPTIEQLENNYGNDGRYPQFSFATTRELKPPQIPETSDISYEPGEHLLQVPYEEFLEGIETGNRELTVENLRVLGRIGVRHFSEKAEEKRLAWEQSEYSSKEAEEAYEEYSNDAESHSYAEYDIPSFLSEMVQICKRDLKQSLELMQAVQKKWKNEPLTDFEKKIILGFEEYTPQLIGSLVLMCEAREAKWTKWQNEFTGSNPTPPIYFNKN